MYLNLQLKGDSLVYLASAWEGLEKKRSYLAFVLEGLGKKLHLASVLEGLKRMKKIGLHLANSWQAKKNLGL